MTSFRLRARVFCSLSLLTAMMLLAASSPLAAQQGAPPAPIATGPPPLAPLGIPNFGRVTEMLYRGGQPKPESYEELKALGIEIVVNFREERDKIEVERREVEALGLRYVNIPWSSWHRPPTQRVAEFLALLRANPQKKIFVHCHRGADRTGVMVAAYRMAVENWTPPQALAEMKAFHFHRFWLRHLKSYVEDFPRLLDADPAFRALHLAAPAYAP
jgi:protein-tyrosine phosphatase